MPISIGMAVHPARGCHSGIVRSGFTILIYLLSFVRFFRSRSSGAFQCGQSNKRLVPLGANVGPASATLGGGTRCKRFVCSFGANLFVSQAGVEGSTG